MAVPAHPACSACGATAIAQWQRRPTSSELSAERARVAAWREEKIRDGLAPETYDFGPLPELADVAIAVFGCADHAIHIDLAARIHATDCAASPDCGCIPESAPKSEPAPEVCTLPSGWGVPAAGASRPVESRL